MNPDIRNRFEQSIIQFSQWLERTGYDSYDPYDLWGTRYGLWSRKIYYRKGRLAAILILPIVAADIFCPRIRKLLVRKKRYATADAQLALAYLSLNQVAQDETFLRKAEHLAQEILDYAIPGYRGLCWGYPFDWQNNKAMWPKNTPYITCTPYCYELYTQLYDATGHRHYLEISKSIAQFVKEDLNDTPYSNSATAGSYSPIDNSMVVNASAYRAFVLIDAGKRFELPDYTETGLSNLRFVQQCQQEDGAWLYGLDTPADRFIDHFHTCFNLKNLIKLNHILHCPVVEQTIRKGYNWYQANLFLENGRPMSFAKQPRFQIAELEMYNYAEAITLGTLLKQDIPEAWENAQSLALDLVHNFQSPKGYFVTRTFKLGLKHSFPFIRWPQAQLFLALANLKKSISEHAA